MTISKEYYSNLSVEELVQDDYFITSVLNPNDESTKYWNDFLGTYPNCKGNFYEASQLVRSLKFRKKTPPPGLKEKLWNDIISESKQQSAVLPAPVVPMKKGRSWIGWAAAASVIAMAVIAYTLMGESNVNVNTRFTEVKQVVLPDQSVVTMNANSSIRYKKDWKEGQPREVWLTGEAYFDVKHLHKEGETIREHDRFIVHAGETNVEVLGTTFNVSERQTVTRVMLESGKVRIDFNDKRTASVLMEPGEVVKYDQQSKRLVKEKTEVEKYTSWKRKEFLLNNTSVEEIVGVIENTFGYKVVIEGQDMLNRQLSGTGKVSLENEETLFRSLELLLEVKITKKDDTLFIKKN